MKIITGVKYEEATVPFGENKVRIVRNGVLENEEIIERVFTNCRGEKIGIGMVKDVQDLIGLPFSYFEQINKILSDTLYNTNRALVIIQQSQSTFFFQRLKFLFTGKLSSLLKEIEK